MCLEWYDAWEPQGAQAEDLSAISNQLFPMLFHWAAYQMWGWGSRAQRDHPEGNQDLLQLQGRGLLKPGVGKEPWEKFSEAF